MDAGSLGVMVPIAAIFVWGAVKVAGNFSQTRATGADPETARRLANVEQEVGALRQELGEAQERLDFTERLLTQHRSEALDPPK